MKKGVFIVFVLLMLGMTQLPAFARIDAPTAPTAITVNIASPVANAVVGSSSTVISGTATPGAYVWIYIDARLPIRVTPDAGGVWSYTATGLSQGNHTVRAEAELPERYLYASVRSNNGNPDAVYIYDTDSLQQIAIIPTYAAAEGIASHSRSGTIYACTAGSTLSGTIVTIRGGSVINEVPSVRCSNMTTNILQTRLYVAVLDGWVDTFDITGGQNPVFLNRITVRQPMGALHDPVFDPTDSDFLWITEYGNPGATYLVDVSSNTLVRTCPIGGRRMTISPDGQTLYIGDSGNDQVLFVNATTCQVIRSVDDPLATTLEDLELSPDKTEVWVNVQNSTQILAINRTTGASRAITTVGTSTGVKGGIITSNRHQQTFVGANNRIAVLNANGTTQALLPMIGVVYEFSWGSEFASTSRPFSVDLTSDVSLTKTHSGNFTVGQQGTYTLAVRNNGPAAAQAPIMVTDTLPLGLSYVSAVGTGWTCSATGQIVTCSTPNPLAANATAAPITVTVNVGAAAAPSVINSACVGSRNDDVPNNDCDDDLTTVIPVADIRIRKTSDPFFVVGTTGTYTLTVDNRGPNSASAPITVTDTLPTGLGYVSASGTNWTCSASGQTLRCVSSTAVAANTTAAPIHVRVSILSTAVPRVVNTATVAMITTDTDITNNTSTVTTPVLTPAISIFKSADPPSGTWVGANQLITYTLRITNTGTLTLTNALVSDSVPQFTTYILNSAQPTPVSQTSPLQWRFSALNPGEARTVRFTIRVQALGTILDVRNRGSVTTDQTGITQSNETVHPFDPTAINLTRFSITNFPPYAFWETASEHNTAGFNLYYTLTDTFTGPKTPMNVAIIPAKGSPTQGASYERMLLDVGHDDVPLYFWLEEVEQNGATNIYGPEVLLPVQTVFLPFVTR